jgi:predicted aspartyl protease
MLESEDRPDPEILVPDLQQILEELGIQSIERVELYGQQSNATSFAWNRWFTLDPSASASPLALQEQAVEETDCDRPGISPLASSQTSPVKQFPSTTSRTNSQQSYQTFMSVVIAVVLILIGANLQSFSSLLVKSKPNSKTIALTQPNSGIYHAPIIKRVSGVPIIYVTFNGNQRFPMAVDTGASGTLITPEMATALGVATVEQVKARTANGDVILDTGYVSSMEVDGVITRDVLVAIGLPDLTVGLLGHDFFGNFDVTVRQDTVEFHPRQ